MNTTEEELASTPDNKTIMTQTSVEGALDSRLVRAFGPYLVMKELVQAHEMSRLPRFISEYLIAKFYPNGHPTQEEVTKLQKFVTIHFPELRDRDKILHDVMTQGSYTLMDEFKVETDIKGATHRLIIPSLSVRDAKILPTILDENADLLRSGMWGVATLKYTPEEQVFDKRDSGTPVLMTKFTPFEVVNVRLSEFAEKRKPFSRGEWIDLLIKSVGLNPAVYDENQKHLILLRLVPLVESNCNVLELGPKATGKTYLYRNVSYSTRLISGGKVSPATLFYNIATKTVGEISFRDCVVLDEIGKLVFANSEEMIGKLKDYMVDGFFERGPKKAQARASLVFMGNMELSVTRPSTANITSALPAFMRDSAFLDRIHASIPGWELPKIRQSNKHLATGYGIVVDYLSEVFHQMTMQGSYSDMIWKTTVDLENATIRDEKAIKKVASGLLKLLCPDGSFGMEDLTLAMNVAVGARQRVNSLLSFLSPQEFSQKKEIQFVIAGDSLR